MLDPTTQSIEIGLGSNEITFWYTRRNDLSYIVNYKEKGTNASLKLPKVVNDVTFGTVIQSAREIVDITGYKYDSVDKDSLTVGADANENEITIFYTKRNDLSYIVRFLELNTYERLRTPKTVEGVEYDTVIRTENEVEPIEGYVFHSSDIDQIRIGTGDNIINLFYKKGKYNYTVYYKETGTNRKLHELDRAILKLSKTELLKVHLRDDTGVTKSYPTGSILLDYSYNSIQMRISEQANVGNGELMEEKKSLNKVLRQFRNR